MSGEALGYLVSVMPQRGKKPVALVCCADVMQAESIKATLAARIKEGGVRDQFAVDVTEVLTVGFVRDTTVADMADAYKLLRGIDLSL